eukprot:Skav222501  [mRNA]  locus=scaffold1835:728037:728342:- [translate_table: standard]
MPECRHPLAVTDPDRALYYKLVLAGGPKQTAKELLDEADLWCASRGTRQAGTARAASGLGLVNAPWVDKITRKCGYQQRITEAQVELSEEVLTTMPYKLDR